MNVRPPQIELKFNELPKDDAERHEVLVKVFGQYVMWFRNCTVRASNELVESNEAREKLGTIRRRKYDSIAALPQDQRVAACQFAEATVDRFIQFLLGMLGTTGIDHRMGQDHAVVLKLTMEIFDVNNRNIVQEEVINRNGEKFFADYWGRWINQFGAKE